MALELHENKSNPVDPPATKIVQAFGLRKCPKLVEQLAGQDVDVRINVLAVLCEEFNNPFTIQGCAQAGIVRVLSTMVSDPDYTTRERSSKALALMSQDANGLSAILADEAVVEILNGIKDPAEVVRSNIYDCIRAITRTRGGVEACVIAGVASSFVEVVKREVDALKPKLLMALHNIAGSADGLLQAINANAVEVCIALLKEPTGAETKSYAAKTLGYLCFDEEAKIAALEAQAVPVLLTFCTVASPAEVKTSVTLALMAITSTDEGKRQMNSPEHVKALSVMVLEDHPALRLNALKVITNIAVFPPIRPLLLDDAPFMAALKKMADVAKAGTNGTSEGSQSTGLLQKHAALALAAVNWTP